jgi:hypothetical protein
LPRQDGRHFTKLAGGVPPPACPCRIAAGISHERHYPVHRVIAH